MASRAASILRRLSRLRNNIPIPIPYPTTAICPSPTCSCAPTPPGLDINHTLPLAGTKPPYAQHIVVCTEREDWASRIEDEDGPNLAKGLKDLLGPRGEFYDPNHPILITNASFPTTAPGASAYLFPSFQHVPHIDLTPSGLAHFVRSALLADDPLPAPPPLTTHALTAPIILICGHGGRDQRCGVLGPLLQTEFRRALAKSGPRSEGEAQVALVSHIGGHKFAGNVIVYLPPGFRVEGREAPPLAGQGVWYGRVEPRHVEGIVAETVGRGRVVGEMVRGWTEWTREGPGG
ncbi:hypothetical protein MMC32_002584 [Xylographa parallela]|nr:hypothetical protein [Xylographa parallela]